MAQSVRGLRQSAALCAGPELPLTMDLLQGSEAVAAVLRRYVRACERDDKKMFWCVCNDKGSQHFMARRLRTDGLLN